MALYAFARLVDDWADEADRDSGAVQASYWHEWIDVCSEKQWPVSSTESTLELRTSLLLQECNSIQLALADTIHRFDISKRCLHELIEGAAFDLTGPASIQDRQQLEKYCYLVASSVGLACLSIWGGNKPEIQKAALDCGLAFQLTNILRDVREDSQRDRIYIPQDLLLAHRVDPQSWLSGRPNGDWQAAFRTIIDWARESYRSGWDIQSALDTDGQRMFSLMWHTYRRLLERIAVNPEAVWMRRVRLTTIEKATLYMQHAITPWYRQRFSGSHNDE